MKPPSSFQKPSSPAKDTTRVNEAITAPRIRLVDENGEMLGVFSRRDALERAFQAGLDLVEISPNAEPPVCKILDYGKYRYAQQKRLTEMKKKQKVIEVKEIKLRPGIDKNDYEVKLRNIKRFLEDENKVKITMQFRGREITHQELGLRVLDRLKVDLEGLIKIEHVPTLEGRNMIMVIAPTSQA